MAAPRRLRCVAASRFGKEEQGRAAGSPAVGSAAIYEGATRSEAVKIGGVGLQIIRDWVLRFNARGPDGLLDGKAPGQPSKLNDAQRQAVARMIESGPIPAVHGVVRWRLIDLAQWIFEEFRITIVKQTLTRTYKVARILRGANPRSWNAKRLKWQKAQACACMDARSRRFTGRAAAASELFWPPPAGAAVIQPTC